MESIEGLLDALHVPEYLGIPELEDASNFILSFSTPTLILIGAAVFALVYWLAMRPKATKLLCDLNNQSLPVQGEPACRRSTLMKEDQYYCDDVKTAYEAFQRGVRISGDGPCLGFRKLGSPYNWISYKEVSSRAEFFGSGLLHRGCSPSPDQFIAVFSQNRPEWVISKLACYTYSMVIAPLYETLGTEGLIHILNTTESSTVICDKPGRAETLLSYVEGSKTPYVKTIILMEPFEDSLGGRGRSCGVDVLSMKDVEDLGKENWKAPMPPKPEDIAVICSTSGTTGKPKLAMLSHKGMVCCISSVLSILQKSFPVSHEDTILSFLPLAHVYELMAQLMFYCQGGRVGFYQGDIQLLMDDCRTLKPTFFPTVPRILNRMYDQIHSAMKSPVKRFLLHCAVWAKQVELRRGIIQNNSIWDWLLFSRIQAILGGRVRIILTGSAPISSTVLSFFRTTLGCLIVEGYGQTECTGACTCSLPGDYTAGHVGPPVSWSTVKLEDVEEMNYFVSNGEGEICVKGPGVFLGYLKDTEKTAEAIDADGWLHTGDVGRWLPNGTLQIIDRKKHLFKLSQGEYIAPEKIENAYLRCTTVSQVFVHGESLQSFLVGIVVPDPEVLPSFAEKRGITGTYEELCRNPEVRKAVLEDMTRIGREAGLNSLEQVKTIYLHPEMFTIAKGMLTPTLKSIRAKLRNYFQQQINQLYTNPSL
ncbi:long-chain-fatty-acid--CoA ligase 5-like [Latimeria chalumnae]|uniref:long-chain-fatty-acid--CoA ligase 5-like n=1 Tax=Latimeria chalumnae TaxID=7897 RepID=UPI0003C1B250|nr:PREDICTED: long-chain-fatty-acid--CoA ligase 5-like [Latimeria chalumnae]XP_014346746.1 PREDICTED: long-chain-fatty-acid--CoA ligase 5-like [Latimeria chalumnae]|eukprot:XP_006000791.1 PREDICTED: long-chain-fatty-acid--CoA ligase 5-like [Latimeria chalumnae]